MGERALPPCANVIACAVTQAEIMIGNYAQFGFALGETIIILGSSNSQVGCVPYGYTNYDLPSSGNPEVLVYTHGLVSCARSQSSIRISSFVYAIGSGAGSTDNCYDSPDCALTWDRHGFHTQPYYGTVDFDASPGQPQMGVLVTNPTIAP